MYAEAPRKLVLVGRLDTPEMMSLTDYCHRLHASGRNELYLNLDGVTECRRAALEGILGLLAGSTKLTISVEGAHWRQFKGMLNTAPIADIPRLGEAVREPLRLASPPGPTPSCSDPKSLRFVATPTHLLASPGSTDSFPEATDVGGKDAGQPRTAKSAASEPGT